jgi:hypothetical protein
MRVALAAVLPSKRNGFKSNRLPSDFVLLSV